MPSRVVEERQDWQEFVNVWKADFFGEHFANRCFDNSIISACGDDVTRIDSDARSHRGTLFEYGSSVIRYLHKVLQILQ